MPRKAATVAFYPDRARGLLLAVVGELMAVASVWAEGQPGPSVVTHPWLYEEPIKTIFVVLAIALFGIPPIFLVLRAIFPWPVLTLDAEGIHYYPWMVFRRLVRWDEIQRVSTSTRRYRSSTVLTIRLTLTPRVQHDRGGKGDITLRLGQGTITVPIEEVAERVTHRFHAMRPQAVERAIRVPRP